MARDRSPEIGDQLVVADNNDQAKYQSNNQQVGAIAASGVMQPGEDSQQ